MPDREHLEEHLPSLFRFCLWLTGDNHLAEDLTQETMLRAWKARHSLKSAEMARVWLLRIAANLRTDQLRSLKHRPAHESGVEQLASRRALLPEVFAMEQETRQLVMTEIEALPNRQREVMYLSAVEGFSLADIAQVLDITRNAAKVSLCEARKKLRQSLASAEEAAGREELPTKIREPLP